jgi:hypothetical protein
LVKKIQIIIEKIGSIIAILLEDKNPKTVEAIWNALPFEAKAKIWGEEIYFIIPVKIGEENPQESVEIGDIGYWPHGNGFCIFFGPTPISCGKEIIPADPVNIFGKIEHKIEVFKRIKSGDSIRIERLA